MLLVVAVVATAAVLAARGDDDDVAPGSTGAVTTDDQPTGETGAAGGTTPETHPLPPELVGQIRPVTVEGSALPALDDPSDDAAVGLTAPVLTGENFDGAAVTTASDGGPVMVIFLAHWCPHCNAEIPRLLDLEAAGASPTT